MTLNAIELVAGATTKLCYSYNLQNSVAQHSRELGTLLTEPNGTEPQDQL